MNPEKLLKSNPGIMVMHSKLSFRFMLNVLPHYFREEKITKPTWLPIIVLLNVTTKIVLIISDHWI